MNPRVSRVERAREQGHRASRSPRSRRGSRSGYRLDEIMNDITGETPASFEPTIDYVVTKVPRWAFEKLPGRVAGARHDDAVGRRGDGDRAHVPRVAPEGAALARDRAGAGLNGDPDRARVRRAHRRRARAAWSRTPTPERPFLARGRAAARRVRRAAPRGHRHRPVVPRPDPRSSCETRRVARARWPARRRSTGATWRRVKRLGFGDAQLAYFWGVDRSRSSTTRAAPPASTSPTRPSTPARRSSRRARRTTTAPTRTRTRSRRSTGPRS